MCWERSPSATATMTREISVVGRPRSSISELTDADAVRPRAVEALVVEALGEPAVPADDPADPPQVEVLPLLQRDDLVERVRDLAGRRRCAAAAGP